MPIFLDRHDLSGLTAADIAEAHRKDLEVQERYGVRFLAGEQFTVVESGSRSMKGFDAPIQVYTVRWR